MTDDRLVYSFAKNSRETVCACIRNYRGHDLVDLRVFVGGDLGDVATAKGLAVRVDLLPELRAAIDALIREVERDERLAA